MSILERAAEQLRREQPDRPSTRPTAGQASSQEQPVPPPSAAETTQLLDEELHSRAAATDRLTPSLDFKTLEALGYLSPSNQRGRLAEEYRLIKRPLLRNAFVQGAVAVERGNLIMFTSAVQGEGKTFTTLNLAISMAMEYDYTVMLIDSDVLRPALSQFLGYNQHPGLVDLLRDPQIKASDVILHTGMPKLRLIPAGRTRGRTTELLASEAMRNLTQEFAARYDDRIVLFDAPPLLMTSEASVLAHWMGQIMVVVEEGRTPESAIKESVALLDKDKALGTILNKSRGFLRGYYYYGGYYDYYGSERQA